MAPDTRRRRGDEASEHGDEFRVRVDRLRRERGDLDAAWEAIYDLGEQMSVVRHKVGNVEQAQEIRDFRLFGDPAPGGGVGTGGKFGEIRRDISDASRNLSEKVTESSRALTESVKEIAGKQDTLAREIAQRQHDTAVADAASLRRRERWWENWWGRLGVLSGVVTGIGLLVLEIINVTRPAVGH